MCRVVALEELHEKYHSLVWISIMYDHPVVEDEYGRWRWKANSLMRLLIDDAPMLRHLPEGRCLGVGGGPYGIDMGEIQDMYLAGKFTQKEYLRFYMDAGQPLDEFLTIFTRGSQKSVSGEPIAAEAQSEEDEHPDKYSPASGAFYGQACPNCDCRHKTADFC